MKKYHHICIVSAQLIPNYLPLIAPEFEAQSVTLIVTEKMRKLANRFRKVLRKQFAVTADIEVPETLDIKAQWRIMSNTIQRYKELEPEVPLIGNISGGTKIMSLALAQCCTTLGVPFLYVESESNTMTKFYVDREEKHLESSDSIKITRTPPLSIFFKLYDFDYSVKTPLPENERWMDYACRVLADLQTYRPAIHVLNGKLQKCVDRNGTVRERTVGLAVAKDPSLTEKENGWRRESWNALKDLLCEYGLAEVLYGEDKMPKKLKFLCDNAVKFCNGAWLEIHTYNLVKKIVGDRGEVVLNAELLLKNKEPMKGGYRSRDPQNEFDVIAYLDNTIYAFECKTIFLPRKPAKASMPVQPLGTTTSKENKKTGKKTYYDGLEEANAILTKLKALSTDAFGARQKRCIISVDGFPGPAAERARRENFDITLLHGKDRLRNLEENLRNFILGSEQNEKPDEPNAVNMPESESTSSRLPPAE